MQASQTAPLRMSVPLSFDADIKSNPVGFYRLTRYLERGRVEENAANDRRKAKEGRGGGGKDG